MKRTINLFVFFSMILLYLVGFYSCKFHESNTPKLTVDNVEKIIKAMTLEQKARLVIGLGMKFDTPDSITRLLFTDGKNPFTENLDSFLLNDPNIELKDNLVPGAAGYTAGFKKFNISQLVFCDGPAGVNISPYRNEDKNTYFCTAFPIGTMLATTWDTVLIYQVGQAMGNEVLEYGADIILAPAVNIQRNPLCGRNFEYYSEDPLVVGLTAAAMIKGIQSNGVGTSIKHFAANNQESNRMTSNSVISERALREIYLKGFQIAIENAQPWTVMSSYNLINGIYTSESYDLLTTILRKEWGFKGFVITDWGGGKDVIAQMKSGNDMIQPGSTQQINDIIKAVKEGNLDINILDKNVERILKVLLLTARFNGYKNSNQPNLKSHALIARSAAAEGMVLLKNNDETLPLPSNVKTIAVFGINSYETVIGGTGSGDVNEAYSISIVDGLRNVNYNVTSDLKDIYQGYIKTEREKAQDPITPLDALLGLKPPISEMPIDDAMSWKYSNDADIAIITIGRNSGEGADRTVDADFNLTELEKKMIYSVSQAFHSKNKKVIVLLNIGSVIETASWKDIPDAILLTWQPGQEAGNSVADILIGKVNPSGKLASSFPLKYDDVPSSKIFPGKNIVDDKSKQTIIVFGQRMVPNQVDYNDDIFVGYRYYSTYNVPVSYEFGYGLSYTQFEYSNLKVSSNKFSDSITVTIDIKNTGRKPGREVVQLYLSAPCIKLKKPAKELKGFAKTKILNFNETQTLKFVITKNELASFDAKSSSWIAEAGKYTVSIGASSKDIKQNALFELTSELIVSKVNKALVPVTELKMLDN